MLNRVRFCGWALAMLASAAPALAQSDTPAGVRAAGMGGAFTAVADDASAVAWNPAGLATGAFFGLTADTSVLHGPAGSTDPKAAVGSSLLALSTPALGFSFTRDRTGYAPVAGAASGRNLVTDNAGVTVVQSAGDGLAIGATFKYVHGEGAAGPPASSANAFDLDAGVMKSGGLGRIGLTVRHLFQPEVSGLRLERVVRAGVAINLGARTVAAVDSDVTTANSVELNKRWRDAAIGIEHRPTDRLALRSGVHWNTAGGPAGTAPIISLGASYGVYGATSVDVQWSGGSSEGNRGWGAGLRFAF